MKTNSVFLILTLWFLSNTMYAAPAASIPLSQNEEKLFKAVHDQDLETVDHLLFAVRCNPNVTDERGSTPLHYAVRDQDNLHIVIALLHKANVDARDANQLTPLHCAIDAGAADFSLFLLHRGANPNAESKTKRTPVMYAAIKNDLETMGLLLNHRNTLVDQQDQHGYTALHFAAACGHRRMMSLLKAVGARSDIEDNRGLMPEHHYEIYRTLNRRPINLSK